MKNTTAVSVFLCALLFGFGARAEEKKAEKAPSDDIRKLVCHGPHEDRSLEIVTKGKGCVLQYTKQSGTTEAAHAQNSLEPCKAALQKIRARLESGNFACE